VSVRVAILTPSAEGLWADSRWPDVLGRMTEPLTQAGLKVEHRGWTEAGDLTGFDLVMPLLVWGYHRDGDWQAQVSAWERAGVRLQNSAAVLRWNADKSYLSRLADRGARVVPTRFVASLDETALEQAAQGFGAEVLVAKPRVSAGAFQTIRWSPGQPLSDGPDGEAMIQPYLPAIETEGEVSLIYLGGSFSHAIRKRPQPGDFRVQPEYDGIITPHAPSPDELEAAAAVLAAAGEDLLYARIDLVRDLSGAPVLMELELVEPDLYLGYEAGAGADFAASVAAAATPVASRFGL